MKLPKNWHVRLGMSWEDPATDATLGELHEFILRLCGEQHVTPPSDSWEKLMEVVEACIGIDKEKLTPETKLIEDIAPYG